VVIVGVSQHADQQAHLVQRPAGGGLDDGEGLARLSRVGVDHHAGHAGAHGDDAHGVGHDVVKLPGDLRALLGQRLADLLGSFRLGGRRLLRGPLRLLAGVHPAGPRVLPGQPAEQHHRHPADAGRDDLLAAADDGGGQDRAGHEADNDHRGPAGGDGNDGVEGQRDIERDPVPCSQAHGHQHDGEDQR
jgi:hypothetical protein